MQPKMMSLGRLIYVLTPVAHLKLARMGLRLKYIIKKLKHSKSDNSNSMPVNKKDKLISIAANFPIWFLNSTKKL